MGQRNFEKCQPLWRADKGSSKKSTKNDSIEFRKQKKKKKGQNGNQILNQQISKM